MHQEAKYVYFYKTRNKTCMLLKITSNPRGFLESTGRKGSGIHQRNNRQKFEFLLISIILGKKKNVYRLRDLFKGYIKLNLQENIF